MQKHSKNGVSELPATHDKKLRSAAIGGALFNGNVRGWPWLFNANGHFYGTIRSRLWFCYFNLYFSRYCRTAEYLADYRRCRQTGPGCCQ